MMLLARTYREREPAYAPEGAQVGGSCELRDLYL